MRKIFTFTIGLMLLLGINRSQMAYAQDVGIYVGPLLYDQNGDVGIGGYSSFERYNANGIANSFASADDFVVPYGESWQISSVFVKGYSYSDIEYLEGFTVTIYNDKSRKPDEVVAKYYNRKTFFKEDDGVVIYLGSELNLPEGPYWISVQAVSDNTSGNYYYWEWDYLANATSAHIKEQPYYKAYREATVATAEWNPTDTYSTMNFAYSLHAQFNNDLVCQLVSPTTGPELGAETIGVKIFNLGKNTASNFEVAYIIDDTITVTETFNSSLAPLQSAIFSFATKADFSAVGSHTVQAKVSLADDENTQNDMVTETIENQGVVYFANVENGNSITTCEGRYVDAGGFYGETEGIEANYSITFKPSDSTQRSVLTFTHCELVRSGWFGDTETATLMIYDGEDSNAPLLAKVGTVLNGADPVVFTASNAFGALTAVYTELPWTGTSSGFAANVSCIGAPTHDVAVEQILYPDPEGYFTATDSVTVVLKNYGYNDETNFTLSYALNGAAEVVDTIPSLAAGETLQHTFAAKINLSQQGDYHLMVEAILANDENTSNNHLTKSVTNWGTAYNIGADGIAYDTLTACSGVLTDEGGIAGLSGDDYGWSLGPTYTTVLKPETAGSRAQIEFKKLSINAGWITIYNGPTYQDDILIQFTNQDMPAQKIYSTHSSGKLLIEYSVPQKGADEGFIAELSCIGIEAHDIDIAKIESPENLYFVGDSISVQALVRNIGSAVSGTEIKLYANGVAVDSVETGNIDVDSSITVSFKYIAQNSGDLDLTVMASDDEGPASNNSLSVNHFIYKQYYLAESFEGTGIPDYWTATSQIYNYATFTAPHGAKIFNVLDLGYVMTPRLDIKEGDELSFYYYVEAPGMFVPTPGELQLGWYNYETDTYHYFTQTITEAPNSFTKFTYDLSEAVGSNSIVFYNSVPYGNYFIDMVAGPERYFEAHDLDLRALEVPSLVTAGEITPFNVVIRNLGNENLTDGAYSIELYNGDNNALLTKVEGVSLNKDSEVTIPFEFVFSNTEVASVYAKLNYADDVNPMNNSSAVEGLQIVTLSTSYVVSGESDTYQNSLPISVGNNASLSQTVYRADTIGRGGNIKSLAWHSNFSVDMTDIHLKVWVAETDSNDLSAAWIPFDAFTMVYDGALEMKAGKGLVMVNFDSIFNYSGNKNLAIMAYQYSENNDNYSQNFDVTTYVWSDNVSRYYTEYYGDIDMNDAPSGYTSSSVPVVTFFFDKSGVVNLTVKNEAGNPIPDADVALIKNGVQVYSQLTNTNGNLMMEGVAIDQTYTLQVGADGYEVSVTEDVHINADTTILDAVTLYVIKEITGLSTTVNHAEKSATSMWTGVKAFTSYSVYLDDEVPVADSLTATTYTFTDLTDGMHVCGVQSVYEGGVSDIVTDTFYVHYVPVNVDVETSLEKMRADFTWDFEGTSNLFEGFVISLDDTVVDTIVETTYRVNNLTPGEHAFSVATLYESGLSAQAETTFILPLAPTSVVAVATAGSFEAHVTWESPTADSYKVYLDNLSTPVANGITAKEFTLTNLSLGTHVVGISAVYGNVESEITLTTFGITVGVDNHSALSIQVYPNPSQGLLYVQCPAQSNIEVINLAGVVISKWQALGETTAIDLHHLQGGSYLIRVTNNGQINYQCVQLTK